MAAISLVRTDGAKRAAASGAAAARAWLVGGPDAAPGFQAGFRQEIRSPMEWAGHIWKLAERPALVGPALAAARFAPSVLTRLIAATRLA